MLPTSFLQKIAQVKSDCYLQPLDSPAMGNWAHQLFRLLFHFRHAKETEAPAVISGMAFSEHQLVQHVGLAQAKKFMAALPGIYENLLTDAEAFVLSDPAASCMAEILLCYPGFYAISLYRFAHQLYSQGLLLQARIVSEYAHGATSIDIHPAAVIGKSFVIDHGTGTVIGETCLIGECVTIYQGVTLGALSVDKTKKGNKRHPTIENGVTIYAGATILGGNTVIGAGSIIGAEARVTAGVSPGSIVYTVSRQEVKPVHTFSDPIHFFI